MCYLKNSILLYICLFINIIRMLYTISSLFYQMLTIYITSLWGGFFIGCTLYMIFNFILKKPYYKITKSDILFLTFEISKLPYIILKCFYTIFNSHKYIECYEDIILLDSNPFNTNYFNQQTIKHQKSELEQIYEMSPLLTSINVNKEYSIKIDQEEFYITV